MISKVFLEATLDLFFLPVFGCQGGGRFGFEHFGTVFGLLFAISGLPRSSGQLQIFRGLRF